MRRSLVGLFAVCIMGLNGPFLAAEVYPTRIVTMVASLPPGGSVDIVARVLAQQLSKDLTQPFVVENRSGASGLIAATHVSSAKPDGYTLLVTATNLATAPYMVAENKLDVDRDLTPISLVASIPYLMVVNRDIPVGNPSELIAWVKNNPGKFRWGNGGPGSPDQLALLQFNKEAGLQAPLIAYAGTGPAVVAALGGEVSGLVSSPAPAQPHLASGALKALAVTSSEKWDLMPELPTVASFGFPGYEAVGWFAILGPKDLSPEMTNIIHGHLRKALSDPDVIKKLNSAGMTVAGTMSPAELKIYLRNTLNKFGALIKEVNAKN